MAAEILIAKPSCGKSSAKMNEEMSKIIRHPVICTVLQERVRRFLTVKNQEVLVGSKMDSS